MGKTTHLEAEWSGSSWRTKFLIYLVVLFVIQFLSFAYLAWLNINVLKLEIQIRAIEDGGDEGSRKVDALLTRLKRSHSEWDDQDMRKDTNMVTFCRKTVQCMHEFEKGLTDASTPMIPLKVPPGPPSSPGPDGLPGVSGPKGDPGSPGLSGPVGPKGNSGLPGSVGSPGPAGNPGSTGKKGESGNPGVSGAVGPKGDIGLPGSDGSIGPAGTPGVPGEKGETGSSGLPDFQWEPYSFGKSFPTTAVGAGATPIRNSTPYVGRILLNDELILIEVFPNEVGMFVNLRNGGYFIEECQILNKGNFTWEHVVNDKIPRDAFVVERTPNNMPVYVGRVTIDRAIRIGKVQMGQDCFQVFHNSKLRCYHSYDILVNH